METGSIAQPIANASASNDERCPGARQDGEEAFYRLTGFALRDAEKNCAKHFATMDDRADSSIFQRVGVPKRYCDFCQWCLLTGHVKESIASTAEIDDDDVSCARCDMALCTDCWEVCSGCGAFLCPWCLDHHRCGRHRPCDTKPEHFNQPAG